jgi:hypothetical protein
MVLMLGIKLVRLIEKHSEALSRGLAAEIIKSERTSDFRKIPADSLQLAATEVYRKLGEWLLQKPETDIASRFRGIAARRAAEGIRLPQFVWALMLTRDYLWNFLRHEAFADTIIELHGELELLQLLNQFFDRAVYYAIAGYEEAMRPSHPKSSRHRAREIAVSIGLIASPDVSSEIVED